MRWVWMAFIASTAVIPVAANAGEAVKTSNPKPVKIALSAQPTVSTTQTIKPDQLREAIAAALEKQAAGKPVEFSIALLSPEEGMTVPAGAVDLKVRAARSDELVGRRFFDVSVLVNGKTAQTVRAAAQVDAYAEVVTASRYIKPDETISTEDVTIARVPIPGSTTDFIFDMQEVIGKRALRPLQAERLIRNSGIAQAYTVKKGDRVTIEVKRGGLIINAVGVSKSPGAVGQLITVTNQDSGKDLRAKVVGPGTVQVEF